MHIVVVMKAYCRVVFNTQYCVCICIYIHDSFTGEMPVSGCEKCEKGKYSLGGGKLYSKRTSAWANPLPIDVSPLIIFIYLLFSDCVIII